MLTASSDYLPLSLSLLQSSLLNDKFDRGNQAIQDVLKSVYDEDKAAFQSISGEVDVQAQLLNDTLSAQAEQLATASLISGMIQSNLDALALLSQQMALSSVSVLEGYQLSAIASEFSDCVNDHASDMKYLFPISNFPNNKSADNATASNATSSRRLLAVSSSSGAGGSKGSGSVGGKAKNSNLTSVFNGYRILSLLSNTQYNFYDQSRLNSVKCLDASCSNVILGGLFLHTVLRSAHEANLQTGGMSNATRAACSQSRFASLVSVCNDEYDYLSISSSQDLGPVGSDPVFNPSTPLFNVALVASDFYNTSSEVSDSFFS